MLLVGTVCRRQSNVPFATYTRLYLFTLPDAAMPTTYNGTIDLLTFIYIDTDDLALIKLSCRMLTRHAKAFVLLIVHNFGANCLSFIKR